MSMIRAHPKQPEPLPAAPPARKPASGILWALVRISLGLGYLWTFLDLTFGLGLSTPSDRAWLTGNSPTRWSLLNLDGPVVSLVRPTAGVPVVDLILMILLFTTGVTLILGIALWPAAIVNAAMLGASALVRWPEPTGTFVNTHLTFLLLGLGLAAARAGDVWGLGSWWRGNALVRRRPWLW